MNDPQKPENWSSPFMVGDFYVDPGANRILHAGVERHIEPKAMQVLCVLASQQGETVRRETLLDTVWSGRVVVDETLTRSISLLRQVFTQGSDKLGYIKTVPKQGYRLIAPVSEVASVAEPVSSTVASSPASDSDPANSATFPGRRVALAVGLLLVLGVLATLLKDVLTASSDLSVKPSSVVSEGVVRAVEAPSNNRDLDAQSLYMQAQYWWMNGTTGAWFYQARDSLEKAVALDPDFAKAWASLAYIYARYDFHDQYMAQDIAEPRAEAAIRRALSLDERAVDAYLARAILATGRGEFSAAEAAIEQALGFEPDNPVTHYIQSELLLARNAPQAALQSAERAQQLDPLSPWVNVNLGIIHYYLGEMEAASAAIDAALRIDPEYTWAHLWRAMVLHARGQLALAVVSMRRCLELDPSSESNAALMGLLYLDLMDVERARYWFERAASLQGDDNNSRLWDRMVTLVYQRSDDELLLALAADSVQLLHTPRFSLVPVVHAALTGQGQGADIVDWLDHLSVAIHHDASNVAPADNVAAIAQLVHTDSRALRSAIKRSLAAFPKYHRMRGNEAQWLAFSGNSEASLESLTTALEEGWLLHWWLVLQSPVFRASDQGMLRELFERIERHARSESTKLGEWN